MASSLLWNGFIICLSGWWIRLWVGIYRDPSLFAQSHWLYEEIWGRLYVMFRSSGDRRELSHREIKRASLFYGVFCGCAILLTGVLGIANTLFS